MPALLVLVARAVNGIVHQQTEAVQDQLGVLSGMVQEYLTGIERRARATPWRSTPGVISPPPTSNSCGAAWPWLARSRSSLRLTGSIGGVGALVVLWVGGTAVAEGRLSLGSLVAFNGYLAYLAWPTMALGWTLVDRPARADLDGAHP